MLEVNCELRYGKVFCSLYGILDLMTVEKFRKVIANLVNPHSLFIDLEKVSFIDSTGFGALIHIIQDHQKKGVPVEVINVSHEVYEVVELLGLTEIVGVATFKLRDF